MSNTRKLLRGRDWEPLSREIDRACDGIPPDRLRAEMYRGHPGLADQADAAFAETAGVSRRFTASMRDHGVNSVGVRKQADVPGDIAHQVRGLYLRVAAELASGQRRHCPHVTPSAPVPALAPVFDDWAACLARCAPLPAPPAADRTGGAHLRPVRPVPAAPADGPPVPASRRVHLGHRRLPPVQCPARRGRFMTSDLPGREDADRRAEESDRREHQHALERWAARQPREDEADPVHVLRVRLGGSLDAEGYFLARWSLTARLVRDAGASGDEVTDLGPDMQGIARPARPRGHRPPRADPDTGAQVAAIRRADGLRWR